MIFANFIKKAGLVSPHYFKPRQPFCIIRQESIKVNLYLRIAKWLRSIYHQKTFRLLFGFVVNRVILQNMQHLFTHAHVLVQYLRRLVFYYHEVVAFQWGSIYCVIHLQNVYNGSGDSYPWVAYGHLMLQLLKLNVKFLSLCCSFVDGLCSVQAQRTDMLDLVST